MRIVDKIRAYLLDALKNEEEDRFGDLNSLRSIKETALKENYYGIEDYYKNDEYAAIKDWFQGIPLSAIACNYCEIAKIMREWGYKVDENDEEDYYKKMNLYWDVITQVVSWA